MREDKVLKYIYAIVFTCVGLVLAVDIYGQLRSVLTPHVLEYVAMILYVCISWLCLSIAVGLVAGKCMHAMWGDDEDGQQP
jgi:hypothetical protein